jgi:Bacterial protein of unknown function (DUF916)
MFMTKNLHRFFAAGVLLVIVVAALVVQNVAYAQSTGLGIAPRKDLTVQAGKSIEDKLYVTNLNKSASLKLTITVIDFASKNQTGSAALKLDKGADPTPWSLRPFVELPETITLAAGETKNIPYTVQIPKKQGAGSYYSAIQYTAEGAAGESVSVNASAATLMFVTVPGKAQEQMTLQKFGPYVREDKQQDGVFRSLFIGAQPDRFAYILQNTGTVAESPAGSIEVTNIFGKHIRRVKDANPKRNVALIGQTRRFEVCLDTATKQVMDNGTPTKIEYCKPPNLMPGIYKVHLNAFYGINGSNTQEIDTTAILWYFPWWAIIVATAGIAVLAFVVYKLGTVAYVRYRR